MNDERQAFARALRRTVPNVRYFGFDVGGGDTGYRAAANAAASFEDLLPVMAMREELTHHRVGRVLAANPADKVVLMAGSTHLMKDDTRMSAPGLTPAGGGSVRSAGHHVAHSITEGVLAIWMLHGGGRSASPWLAPTGELIVPPGTVNADLASRWDRSCIAVVRHDCGQQRVAQMHNLVLECDLHTQVDAVVFCPQVTPISPDQAESPASG